MNLQELLIHCLWFIMAVFFAGNTHANEVPVDEANAQSTYINTTTPAQQYVNAETHAQAKTANQELLVKIEQLQEELQKLRGRVEVQTHDLQVMRAQQQALYRDLDSRLSKVEGNSTHVVKQQDKQPPKTVATVNDSGEEFYQSAFQLLQNKQYPRAISAFQAFIHNYPKSPYIANSHYWLGELYLSQGFIDKAKVEFTVVINNYQKSSKVPAALLKLGFAYYDNGEWQQARATLNKVRRSYPDTNTARMATSRIQDMDQQGL